jgi:hypothetical protein
MESAIFVSSLGSSPKIKNTGEKVPAAQRDHRPRLLENAAPGSRFGWPERGLIGRCGQLFIAFFEAFVRRHAHASNSEGGEEPISLTSLRRF